MRKKSLKTHARKKWTIVYYVVGNESNTTSVAAQCIYMCESTLKIKKGGKNIIKEKKEKSNMVLHCDFTRDSSILSQFIVFIVVDGCGLLLTFISIPLLLLINGIDSSLRQILVSFQLANLVGMYFSRSKISQSLVITIEKGFEHFSRSIF